MNKKPRYKVGDKVKVKGYYGVLVLDSIDDDWTYLLNDVHWWCSSEKYLNGEHKTNNGDSYGESEMMLI
jgi:hypothetical protein